MISIAAKDFNFFSPQVRVLTGKADQDLTGILRVALTATDNLQMSVIFQKWKKKFEYSKLTTESRDNTPV